MLEMLAANGVRMAPDNYARNLARKARRRSTLAAVAVGSLAVSVIVLVFLVVSLSARVGELGHQVQVLEWACTPVNTGGGVEQCAQPNTEQTPGARIVSWDGGR